MSVQPGQAAAWRAWRPEALVLLQPAGRLRDEVKTRALAVKASGAKLR